MSLVRRIRETIRRLAGKERKFELKPPTPSKDPPKFDAAWLFVAKSQDPVVGWYYRALLHQKVRAFNRPSPPIQGGTLAWNSVHGPLNAGRNAMRKARREKVKAERGKRRGQRRAA